LVRRHWTTSLVMDAVADDRVAASCYALVLATAAGEPPRIERSVVFRDRLVRGDGRWLMEGREVQVDGRT
jgi:SnoaL-like protein